MLHVMPLRSSLLKYSFSGTVLLESLRPFIYTSTRPSKSGVEMMCGVEQLAEIGVSVVGVGPASTRRRGMELGGKLLSKRYMVAV